MNKVYICKTDIRIILIKYGYDGYNDNIDIKYIYIYVYMYNCHNDDIQ